MRILLLLALSINVVQSVLPQCGFTIGGAAACLCEDSFGGRVCMQHNMNEFVTYFGTESFNGTVQYYLGTPNITNMPLNESIARLDSGCMFSTASGYSQFGYHICGPIDRLTGFCVPYTAPQRCCLAFGCNSCDTDVAVCDQSATAAPSPMPSPLPTVLPTPAPSVYFAARTFSALPYVFHPMRFSDCADTADICALFCVSVVQPVCRRGAAP
jgi:hypothetical protein